MLAQAGEIGAARAGAHSGKPVRAQGRGRGGGFDREPERPEAIDGGLGDARQPAEQAQAATNFQEQRIRHEVDPRRQAARPAGERVQRGFLARRVAGDQGDRRRQHACCGNA